MQFRLPTLSPLFLLTLGLSTGCVSQARYDEATQELQYYQRSYQDLSSFVGELEGKIARLESESNAFQDAATVPAGATQAIDERMEELRGLAASLGSAPGDVQVLKVEGGYGMRLSDAVLFDSGKATLTEEGQALVLKLGAEIQKTDYRRIWVRGHTDSDPVKRAATLEQFPHGNLELSAARATEVAALLETQGGIDGKRLVVAGFGPNEPLVANDSAANKSRNRRVEIFVLETEKE